MKFLHLLIWITNWILGSRENLAIKKPLRKALNNCNTLTNTSDFYIQLNGNRGIFWKIMVELNQFYRKSYSSEKYKIMNIEPGKFLNDLKFGNTKNFCHHLWGVTDKFTQIFWFPNFLWGQDKQFYGQKDFSSETLF